MPFRTSSVTESPHAQLRSRRLDVEPATAEGRHATEGASCRRKISRDHSGTKWNARAEAERFRQRAEEARETSERDRESLERIRQEEERTRHLGEADRVAAELRAALPNMAAGPRLKPCAIRRCCYRRRSNR